MPQVRHPRTVQIVSVLTLVSQILIVFTGGLVRLTGSGLGCTDWPHCTPESFFPVAEQGIHGFIEYANRVWGAVVILLAIGMLALAIRHRKRRGGRQLVALAAFIAGITALQALIGAIVVWFELRPDTVGLHFLLSVLLVALSTALVWRVFHGPRGAPAVSRLQSGLAYGAAALFVIVTFMGTLTTGAGPHAGDGGAVRNGLDPAIMQHLHAWPSYGLLAVLVVMLVIAIRRGPRLHLLSVSAAIVLCVIQAIIGVIQANNDLPVPLVAAHLIVSVLVTSVIACVVLSLRRAEASESPIAEPQPAAGALA